MISLKGPRMRSNENFDIIKHGQGFKYLFYAVLRKSRPFFVMLAFISFLKMTFMLKSDLNHLKI